VIAVIHAYSRVNAGDGLLVDLTLQRLERAGVARDDVVVVAMDAVSFADLPHVVKLGTAGRRADAETARAALAGAGVVLARGRAGGEAARVLAAADGFVAVGGGYLRAGTRVNAIGTALNHLPPLVAAARSGRPSIYLPQSIGPLSGRVGDAVRRNLRRVGQVHVRDDRSVDELAGARNVVRTPDLAVLDVADELHAVTAREAGGTPVLVARALNDADTYVQRLHVLARDLGDVTWAVQAEGSAAKSDRTFYDDNGIRPDGRVAELLAAGTGPVVSVRLHGALQSIMSGVPAIHLGYERKSWGAYEDLGIERWVHSARSFDPARVAEQVRELQADPGPYWAAIGANAEALRERSAALDAAIRTALAPAVS
jgi:polysaccharide pyruvyl transferase WcaK-like protein